MKDLTQGSLLSHIVSMAVPIFAGLIVVLACGLIDLYFVSELGEAAIAGVGAAGNAGFLINALTQIVGVGTVANMSQAVGRRHFADANLLFNQSFGLSLAFGSATLIASFALAGVYMAAIAADGLTAEAGTTYLLWFTPALALQFPNLALSYALRSVGIVKPAMYAQGLIVAINVVLAPVLIVGWGTNCPLGVEGAGLASSLAAFIGTLALLDYVRRAEHSLALRPRQWLPQMLPCQRILGVGIPAGGEFAIMFIYMAAIYYALGHAGPAEQAGFSIGSRVLGLIQVPAMALAFAATPIIGQSFGAKQAARVRDIVRTILIAVILVMMIATMIAQWTPELLLRGFTQDTGTIAAGALFLRLVSLNLVAQGVIFACSSAFQGLGDTRPQLISSSVRLVTYVIPTLWLSAQAGFRVEHIWYLSIATTTMQALLSLWLLRRQLSKRLAFPDVRARDWPSA